MPQIRIANRPALYQHQRQVRRFRETHKATLSWKFAPNKMVYATYSTGYRPGGLNRRTGILPYKSDTLDNFEIGWKTSWFDRKLTIGGAVFIEKWKKLQFGLSPVGGGRHQHLQRRRRACTGSRATSTGGWADSSFPVRGRMSMPS
jgi:outer membrane receptor protein involved in Fe transport